MALPIFQRTVVDDAGNVIAGASVTAKVSSTGLDASIYEDREGTTPKANPFVTDANGLAEFYSAQNEYNITAESGALSIEWKNVSLVNTESIKEFAASKIDSVFDVAGFTNLKEGEAYDLVSYHAGSNVGGGRGVGAIARHNGGTAISKTRTRPTDWTNQTQLTAWFADSEEDELCIVRTDSYPVKPQWFGALGGVDETYLFSRALLVNGKVFAPKTDSPYIISGLQLDFDQVIYGDGVIQTTNGTLIDLAKVSLAVDNTPMKLMLTNGIHSWEEMLAIKSLGINTVVCFVSYDSTYNAIRNLEAVGLKCLIFGEFYGTGGTWSVKDEYDDRSSVVGYYPFDEPITNGMPLAEQDEIIDAYRLATKKPIYTSVNAVVLSNAETVISQQFDYIFTDQYSYDTYLAQTGGIDLSIINSLRSRFELAVENKKCRFIPFLGLFNEAPLFTQSEATTVKLTKTLLPLSEDGSFGVFAWDIAETLADTSYVGCRNNTTYHNTVKELVALSQVYKPYRVEYIPIGKSFGGIGKLTQVMQAVADGVVAGEKAKANAFPYDVINVGSAVDDRQQAFEASGICLTSNGARVVFNDMPSGICAMYLKFTDHVGSVTATVSIGASDTGGYNYYQVKANQNITGDGIGFWGGLLSPDVRNTPVIDFSMTAAIDEPHAFVSGYVVFSDAPTLVEV